jgi:hypothetical protein
MQLLIITWAFGRPEYKLLFSASLILSFKTRCEQKHIWKHLRIFPKEQLYSLHHLISYTFLLLASCKADAVIFDLKDRDPLLELVEWCCGRILGPWGLYKAGTPHQPWLNSYRLLYRTELSVLCISHCYFRSAWVTMNCDPNDILRWWQILQ